LSVHIARLGRYDIIPRAAKASPKRCLREEFAATPRPGRLREPDFIGCRERLRDKDVYHGLLKDAATSALATSRCART